MCEGPGFPGPSRPDRKAVAPESAPLLCTHHDTRQKGDPYARGGTRSQPILEGLDAR
jgi:hypothetical protein